MRKQSGFTLIELMVVMAIIAILATAGLSSYGGYLKKARDSTRIADIQALENIAIASFSASGQSVSLVNFQAAVSAMNNGTVLQDPTGGSSCLDDEGNIGKTCVYEYYQCANGGYILRVSFESSSNFYLYQQDKLNPDAAVGSHLDFSYDIGNCDTPGVGGSI